MFQPRLSLVLPCLLLGLAGCPSDDVDPHDTHAETGTGEPTTTSPTTTMTTTGPTTTGDPTSLDTTEGPDTETDGDTEGDTETETETDTEGTPTVCEQLGGLTGIGEIVDAALTATVADPRINGYFLNEPVEGESLSNEAIRDCLVIQLAALAADGECEDSVYPTDDCRPMDEAHTGLGISTADFEDLAGHFADALEAADTPRDITTTVLDALAGMAGDIVEDVDNDESVYQRMGRKPAVQAGLEDFMAAVALNAELNAFFVDDNNDPIPSVESFRLATCLTRQMCDLLGGPCVYGGEVDAPDGVEPGVAADAQCLGMSDSHDGVTDNADGPITSQDFNAFVVAFRNAMVANGMSVADENNVLTPALLGMENDIVPQ
jgi:truncated hemoglobin YjbI